MAGQRITEFNIGKDLVADKTLKVVRVGLARDFGEVALDPDERKSKGQDLSIQEYALGEDELRKYAGLATKLREKFNTGTEATFAEEELSG